MPLCSPIGSRARRWLQMREKVHDRTIARRYLSTQRKNVLSTPFQGQRDGPSRWRLAHYLSVPLQTRSLPHHQRQRHRTTAVHGCSGSLQKSQVKDCCCFLNIPFSTSVMAFFSMIYCRLVLEFVTIICFLL